MFFGSTTLFFLNCLWGLETNLFDEAPHELIVGRLLELQPPHVLHQLEQEGGRRTGGTAKAGAEEPGGAGPGSELGHLGELGAGQVPVPGQLPAPPLNEVVHQHLQPQGARDLNFVSFDRLCFRQCFGSVRTQGSSGSGYIFQIISKQLGSGFRLLTG